MTLIENGMVIYQHEGSEVELWVPESIELFLQSFFKVELLQAKTRRHFEEEGIVYLRMNMPLHKRDELKAGFLQAMFETRNINYN